MKTKSHLLLAGLVLGLIHSAWAQPIITQQPQNQTNIAGTTATFTVGPTGAEPLSYQWRSHANATTFTNIPFGTEATLALTNVQPTTRQFGVVVTDGSGLSVTSRLASLTVLVPPSVTNQPASRTVGRCANVTFSVSVSGTAPLRYQWRWNEMDLAGKTNSTLVLTKVETTNAGGYVVVVTNSVGSITSKVATLTVDPSLVGYNALYVFGSSWADTQHTGIYWQGHWSNGPMWPEFLSTNFGLAYIPANNLAVGGSLTDVVLSQATNFNPPANPELCLYHFWAAYTDIRRTPDNLSSDVVWNSRIVSWVGNISNAVVQLYGKGARSIMVPSVFDRSREPWAITSFGSNSANQLLLRQRISEFNAALAAVLENIDRARPDLRLYTLNMQSKVDELHANAASYGFTKTFPGAIDDPSLADKSFTGPGQDYLYWDSQHATSKAHKIIAAWNLEAITNSVLERLAVLTVANAFSLRMSKLQICRDYTLQHSSDLASWQDVHTFTASAGTNEWVVPMSEMSSALFRLKWMR